MRVLDAAGNTIDAAFVAALAALMAFKRPDVSVKVSEDGARSSAVMLPITEREAVPLSLHQAPLAVSFALFQVAEISNLLMVSGRILRGLACACAPVYTSASSRPLPLQECS